jgi:uncharacterized protein
LTKSIIFKNDISFPIEEVFSWHERKGAFERLLPPWEKISIRGEWQGIKDGSDVYLVKHFGFLSFTWHLRHEAYKENVQFVDRQVKGPFKSWKHTHGFAQAGDQKCILTDSIEYAIPHVPVLGSFVHRKLEKELKRLFFYRNSVITNDLEAHSHGHKLRIAISGSSGLIGAALKNFFLTGGHTVIEIKRKKESSDYSWATSPAELENLDAVINLAGESILGLWSNRKKEAIRDSRVIGTRKLIELLALTSIKPKTFISASGISFYGNQRTEECFDNKTPPAREGFLAHVSQDWEKSALLAKDLLGARVVCLRFPPVLSPKGGVLKNMIPAFKLGLGAVIGDPANRFNWVSIRDVIYLINFCMINEQIEGAVNVANGASTTNQEFADTLAKVLCRPRLISIPKFLLKNTISELADEILLTNINLQKSDKTIGFNYLDSNLHDALKHMFGSEST